MIVRTIALLFTILVFVPAALAADGFRGDSNSFEVWLQGNRAVMQRDSEDKYPNEGILENPADPKPVGSKAKP